MANFDVAVGITQAGINSTLSTLFKNPTAQSKIFNQTITKEVSGIKVVVDFSILDSPVIVMAPPSVTKWQASFNDKGKQQTGNPPTNNVFQIILSNIKISGNISGSKVLGQGEIEVFGEFSLSKNVLTVDALSVWVDESKWKKDGFTKAIVNAIIIPHAIDTINNLLNAIPFPKIPSKYITASFQDAIMGLTNANELVVATSMKTSPTTSLTSYTPPPKEPIYLQAGISLINTVLAEKLSNHPFEEKDSTGNKDAKASAEIKGTLKSIVAKISQDKTVASINMVNISGYGELSGIGVTIAKTVLCPIGTAIDAISDPKNWDKIISSFTITYKPNPLDVPFSLKITATKSVELSVGEVKSVEVIAAPKWSGVIGSILASLAAGFVDLLSAILKGKIVNSIIKSHAQNLEVYKNASISKTIEGIDISLSGEVGAALTPQGTNYVVEGFTVTFS